jgi:hypothetical protein
MRENQRYGFSSRNERKLLVTSDSWAVQLLVRAAECCILSEDKICWELTGTRYPKAEKNDCLNYHKQRRSIWHYEVGLNSDRGALRLLVAGEFVIRHLDFTQLPEFRRNQAVLGQCSTSTGSCSRNPAEMRPLAAQPPTRGRKFQGSEATHWTQVVGTTPPNKLPSFHD